MDTTRAKRQLGWTAGRSAGEALVDLLTGCASARASRHPRSIRAPRVRELVTRVGAR